MYLLTELFYIFCCMVALSAPENCPPISGHTINTRCQYEQNEFPCDRKVKPGTTAQIKCAFMYEKMDSSVDENLYCQSNGKWNKPPFECEQLCGTINTRIPYILNGEITENQKVPWHVAIYMKNFYGKYQYTCGGTLIKSNTVVSAAHCFWDKLTSRLHNESNYLIAVGKFYRDYYVTNETEAVQTSEISKITIPFQFAGEEYNFISDIAILTLKGHILFKNHIKPACMPWETSKIEYSLNNKSGVVAGWGSTNTEMLSPELRSVKLLSSDVESCRRKITKNDKIPNDKFCVEGTDGKNICQGDSGGGFLIPIDINGITRYHLYGVVSNSIPDRRHPDANSCNSHRVVVFTNVILYRYLVTKTLNNHSSVASSETYSPGCFIPQETPLNFTDTKTFTNLTPGTYIKTMTTIMYSCPKNTLLYGEYNVNLCNGNWVNSHPSCIKMCPPIPDKYINRCHYEQDEVSCDEYAAPGTTATINCAIRNRGPETVYIKLIKQCLLSGEWTNSTSNCEEINAAINPNPPSRPDILSNIYNSNCHVPRGTSLILTDVRTNTMLAPGMNAQVSTIVSYACPPGSVVYGQYDKNFCNGNWINPHPECRKLCLLTPDESIIIRCYYTGIEFPCNNYVTPGTIAIINCAFMYQKPQNRYVSEKLICQMNGEWDYSPFQCERKYNTNIAAPLLGIKDLGPPIQHGGGYNMHSSSNYREFGSSGMSYGSQSFYQSHSTSFS